MTTGRYTKAAEKLMAVQQRWDDDPVDNGYKLYEEAASAAEELDIAQFEVNELKAKLALATAVCEAASRLSDNLNVFTGNGLDKALEAWWEGKDK